MDNYDSTQVMSIDLHRRRTVMVRMTRAGKVLDTVGGFGGEQGALSILPRAFAGGDELLECGPHRV